MKIKIPNKTAWKKLYFIVGSVFIFLFLMGCQPDVIVPTAAAVAPTLETLANESTLGQQAAVNVPPTWTPQPILSSTENMLQGTLVPTSTFRPTKTPFPTLPPTLTYTPAPTEIITAVPATNTPEPIPTNENSPPSIPANPNLGANLLPNSSFEDGHYNLNGIPELQLPVGWKFEWDESRTGFGDEVWDVYLRPEIRVMSENFLPASEHSLFIFDGKHTIKAFKQDGAISFKLFREVYLEPGTYVLEINFYPDLYMDYQEGVKIWADDPLTGQARFIAPGATGWMGTVYGRKNTLTHTFTVETAETIPIGAAMRGNHAIMNDGWFLDDWSLKRVEG